jgi:GAF domain-containing protein
MELTAMWRKRSATFRYAVYGALFGFLFPIFSTLWEVWVQQLPLAFESILEVQKNTALLWVIDTAPFFLGLFASFAGRRQDRLTRLNEKLEQRIEERDQALRQLETLQVNLKQRTRDLEQQAIQLAAVADVGRAAASILELETLTRRVVELVRERFGLYYVGLFLLDDPGQHAVLEAGTGEAGRAMQQDGFKQHLGGVSVVGMACAQKRACITRDMSPGPQSEGTVEAIYTSARFDNPLLTETQSEMALPLMVGERVLGALDVQSTQRNAFSEDDLAILQLVADQVAVAVDNALKFSEEAELLEATDPLFRAGRRLTMASTSAELVQAILDSVSETEADGCAVARLDSSSAGKIEAATFLGTWSRQGKSLFPANTSFPVDASPFPLQTATTYWAVEDMAQDTKLPNYARQYLKQFGFRALVNVPLLAGEQVSGFVSIFRTTPGPFSSVSLRLYLTIVDQAAVALERARLLEVSQRQARREHTVRDITDRVASSFDIDTILRTTMDEVGKLVGADGGYIELGVAEKVTAE